MGTPHVPSSSPFASVMALIRGAFSTQLIGTAARLGIADLLRDGPRTSDDLAQALGAHPLSLHRFLRGLVLYGILAEVDGGRFGLTPLGDLLRSDAKGSVLDLAIMVHELSVPALGALRHAVTTGEPAFDRAFGRGLFDHFAADREIGARFDRWMTQMTGVCAAAAVAAYDFSSIRTLVDVGGGRGHFLAQVLKANPAMRGVLFDLPPMLAEAKPYLESEGVLQRCSLEPGSFFESMPSGGDAYLLSWILHDWDDDTCARILARCREALSERGRILVVEQLLPERVEQDPMAISRDLDMLTLLPGRERTLAEYTALLGDSGFEVTRVVPLASPLGGTLRNIIEASPAR